MPRRKSSLASPSARPRSADDLGFLLRQAAGVHRLKMDRALADVAVTPPQFLVLTLLAADPGRSSADLARVAALTTATISVIVSNLERMGALTRRPHLVHGRLQHLYLSETGQQLLDACRTRAKDVEHELTTGLSGADAAVIREWLTRHGVGQSSEG